MYLNTIVQYIFIDSVTATSRYATPSIKLIYYSTPVQMVRSLLSTCPGIKTGFTYVQTRFVTDVLDFGDSTTSIPMETLFRVAGENQEIYFDLTERYILDPRKLPNNGTLFHYILVIRPSKTVWSYLNLGTRGKTVIRKNPHIVRVRKQPPTVPGSTINTTEDKETIPIPRNDQSRASKGVRFVSEDYSDDDDSSKTIKSISRNSHCCISLIKTILYYTVTFLICNVMYFWLQKKNVRKKINVCHDIQLGLFVQPTVTTTAASSL